MWQSYKFVVFIFKHCISIYISKYTVYMSMYLVACSLNFGFVSVLAVLILISN